MSSHSATFRRAVFILFDGARADVFRAMLDAGELPAIRERLVEPGAFREAVAAFPTVSGPGHLPFMTGCFPGTLNVPGIYWFDRDAYGRSRTGLHGLRTYLGPFKVWKMTRDVAPHTPTIADLWPDALLVFAWYRRGLPRRALLTRWTKSVSFLRGLWSRDWLRCDADAEDALLRAVERPASLVFAVFPAPDELGHRFGPLSDEARTAYARLDGTIERLFDRLARRGEAGSTLVMIASDHGQSPTHTHFDLDRFVAGRVGRTMVYKRYATPLRDVRAVVFPSGNGMANVHFRGLGWTSGRPDLTREPYAGLIRDLVTEEAVDLAAFREPDSGPPGAIRVVGRRGTAHLREPSPGEVDYEPVTGDPFGYGGLHGRLSFEEWLRATASLDYPDAPVGLATLMRAPRSGDLVVTARPGYDLRSWFEYQEPHGTHGALHRDQALVPVVTNAPLAAGPLRTVDVFPTLAALTGRPVPPGVEGRSRVLVDS